MSRYWLGAGLAAILVRYLRRSGAHQRRLPWGAAVLAYGAPSYSASMIPYIWLAV